MNDHRRDASRSSRTTRTDGTEGKGPAQNGPPGGPSRFVLDVPSTGRTFASWHPVILTSVSSQNLPERGIPSKARKCEARKSEHFCARYRTAGPGRHSAPPPLRSGLRTHHVTTCWSRGTHTDVTLLAT